MKDKIYGYCGIICNDCRNFMENMNCHGCILEEKLLENCPTRSCAISKHLHSCIECNNFPCKILNEFYNDGKDLHKKAFENLVFLKNQKYSLSNKYLWENKTGYHIESDFYNVDEFKKGKLSLLPIELNELKNAVDEIKGKRMLHLQCHFGLDSLSWAKLGVDVTGVDFSNKSIEYAKKLSEETGILSKFICSDIYDLPEILNEKESFDIVFTSYGVLCWLHDLRKWANIISYYLKKGGLFYIVELHPFIMIFENEQNTRELKVKFDYFHSDKPQNFISKGTYADRDAKIECISYEWSHSISDIINNLINAGLKIEFFNEHPFCCYDHFQFMKRREDGLWIFDREKLKEIDLPELPFTFSILARKL
ncbi:MAG: class I SAM-dependent methyltransferase [Exilispira sp.]|jgi:SAM-dependent methyltransferase|nr:class I SAM-dependent methyltransferase [Exilispira sp.]